LPLDIACRVWDIFCRDGEEFLFRTALGMLKNLKCFSFFIFPTFTLLELKKGARPDWYSVILIRPFIMLLMFIH
jgi:hypothetical protein